MSDQPDPTTNSVHKAIINAATQTLGRDLTEQEKQFITSRGGCIALEAIMDTVRAETRDYVEHYLNSEP